MTDQQPTARDLENAAIRQQIAERQAEAYGQVLLWALAAFGPGWLPSCRHFLVDHAEEARVRYTNERPQVAATVYTVKRHDGCKRHFTVDAEGTVTECDSYQVGFGDMLLEPHPTHRIEVRGEMVAPHRYSLCWAPIETYHPRSAEQLAALRVSREKGRAEREERKWVDANPLLAWAERQEAEDEERGR
jgi:hypothetical protein